MIIYVTSDKVTFLNTFEAGLNQAVRAKTTRSHVALRARNSGAGCGRELFKGSKDLASLLVCTRKKIVWLGVDFLWVTS